MDKGLSGAAARTGDLKRFQKKRKWNITGIMGGTTVNLKQMGPKIENYYIEC